MSEQTATNVPSPDAPGFVVETAPALRMYRALVGVGLLCGLLIVVVFQATKPVIEGNRAEALQAAVFRVVPGAATTQSFEYAAGGVFQALAPDSRATEVVHVGYDGEGGLVGVAFEGAGMGYQDTVRVLFGYSPSANEIVGMEILESRETPGLGDKAEKDEHYVSNYHHLDVSLSADGGALSHPVEIVKPGAKAQPWQIDTISGATITSTAVARIAGQSASVWVPRIEANLDSLKRPN